MPSEEDLINALIKATADMPKPGPAPDPMEWDSANMYCACKKLVPRSSMPDRNTGVLDIKDNICHGCEGMSDGYAIVVCCQCRIPVMWVPPHKAKGGFEFLPGKYYHTEHCPGCEEGLVKSIILEQLVFYRERGIPYEL